MTISIARPPAEIRPVTPPRPAEPGRPRRGSTERAAVLTLTAAIIFQPILHPSGPGNSSPVDLLTIAAIVMAAVWAAGSHRKLRAPYALPVALYLAAGAASGLVSLLPNTALLTLAVDVLLFAWCATVVNVLSAPRALRCALVAWSWSGIFWAAVVIAGWAGHISFLEGLNAADGNRVMFTFGDPNYASWYWVATIFILYASRAPAARWMRIAGYGALVWALVLSESNGGMLALGVGVVFLTMVRSYRRHGVAGVLATGLAISLAAGVFFTVLPLNELRQWAATSNQPLLVNSIGRSAQSSAERSLLVHESLQLYQGAGGLLGTGPASTKPLLTQWLYPYANEAHDDYLAALTERGVLGLFAFLLLVGSAISRASPVVRRPLSAPFAAAVPRPAGIVAALLAISLNSYYEEVQHFRVLWLLLGIVAILGRDAMRNRPATGRRRPGRTGMRVIRPVLDPPARPRGARSHRLPNGTRALSRHALSNLGAQGGALAAVSVASLLVARVGGPTVVGEYALLRVLPWLFGVVLSCGLPTASAFFLAGREARDPRLRPTLSLFAVIGAGVGALAWLACVIPFHALLFRQMPAGPLFLMAVVVVTQLWTVTAKGCCQGSGDLAGANMIIVAEELWFVAAYPAVLLTLGYHRATSVVIALVISGALATATGLIRLQRRRFFAGWAMPSPVLARKIAIFGGRGQLGNMLWLMNLRFDFILLDALAGPAVLGIYAVASKVAELMRLVPTAMNYVLYPRFARLSLATATAEARRLQPRATALTLVLTPVLALAAYIGLPILYGKAFSAAVLPGQIIIVGLSIEGAAAVSSAFLLGRGHPGLNSVGMGVGAVITVALDVVLIPRYGALGGAITSAVTYLATTTVLVVMARKVAAAGGTDGRPEPDQPAYAPAHRVRRRQVPGADSGLRRAVDVLVAGLAVTLMLPLFVLIAVAVRLTSRGPALYRQVRVGRSGELFTILKFRSMCSGADRAGPLVTYRSDPRVTRLGGWLRVTKLDELPQLVNVIKGDMTLIGPRPEVPRFIPAYTDGERAVLDVRPGITGPGQIVYTNVQAGADAAEDPETYYTTCELHPKLAIDLDYLRGRGLRSDIRILAQTVLLLAGPGQDKSQDKSQGQAGPSRPAALLRPHARLERHRDRL